MTADIVGAKVTCFAFLVGVEVDGGAEEAELEEGDGGRALAGVEIDADAERAGLEEGDGGRALAGVDEVGVEIVFNLLKRASISSKMLASASS